VPPIQCRGFLYQYQHKHHHSTPALLTAVVAQGQVQACGDSLPQGCRQGRMLHGLPGLLPAAAAAAVAVAVVGG